MGFTDDEYDLLRTINNIENGLTIFAALFIMTILISSSSMGTYGYRLIFYLAICDIGHAGILYIQAVDKEWTCYFQGLVLSFFGTALILTVM